MSLSGDDCLGDDAFHDDDLHGLKRDGNLRVDIELAIHDAFEMTLVCKGALEDDIAGESGGYIQNFAQG